MKRIVIDNMIVDKIMEEPGFLDEIKVAAKCSKLIFIVPHVLLDQLAAITTNPDRRKELLAIFEALPKRFVPTRGAVSGISRSGMARSAADALIHKVRTGGRGGMYDALYATTAGGDADVLVTEDTKLINKMKSAGAKCDVWQFSDLLSYVRRCSKA